jgi:hypothetical protein
MDWSTLKTDIETDWRNLIATVETDAPKVEAVLTEIMQVLGAYATVSGGPVAADISLVAKGLYSLVDVTTTTAAAVSPTAGPSVTATQLVAAADAVAAAVPGFAAALKATGAAVDTTVADVKAEAAH